MAIFNKAETAGKMLKMLETAEKIRVWDHEAQKYYFVKVINICPVIELICDDIGVNWMDHRDFDYQSTQLQKICKHYGLHYYARGREDFFVYEGAVEAGREGFKWVVVEDLS